jgi:hypothetical protein
MSLLGSPIGCLKLAIGYQYMVNLPLVKASACIDPLTSMYWLPAKTLTTVWCFRIVCLNIDDKHLFILIRQYRADVAILASLWLSHQCLYSFGDVSTPVLQIRALDNFAVMTVPTAPIHCCHCSLDASKCFNNAHVRISGILPSNSMAAAAAVKKIYTDKTWKT